MSQAAPGPEWNLLRHLPPYPAVGPVVVSLLRQVDELLEQGQPDLALQALCMLTEQAYPTPGPVAEIELAAYTSDCFAAALGAGLDAAAGGTAASGSGGAPPMLGGTAARGRGTPGRSASEGVVVLTPGADGAWGTCVDRVLEAVGGQVLVTGEREVAQQLWTAEAEAVPDASPPLAAQRRLRLEEVLSGGGLFAAAYLAAEAVREAEADVLIAVGSLRTPVVLGALWQRPAARQVLVTPYEPAVLPQVDAVVVPTDEAAKAWCPALSFRGIGCVGMGELAGWVRGEQQVAA
jgi:hypothetical protein